MDYKRRPKTHGIRNLEDSALIVAYIRRIQPHSVLLMFLEIPPLLSTNLARAFRQANQPYISNRHFMVNRPRFMAIAMTATYFEYVRTFESRADFEAFMEDDCLVCMEHVLTMDPQLGMYIAALLAILATYGQQF